MWKNRSLFCFLVQNIILNKELLYEQIFTMYSYSTVDSYIRIWTLMPSVAFRHTYVYVHVMMERHVLASEGSLFYMS